jgi:hypothetical protein
MVQEPRGRPPSQHGPISTISYKDPSGAQATEKFAVRAPIRLP